MKFVADRRGGDTVEGMRIQAGFLKLCSPPSLQKNTMFSMSQFIHKAVYMYKYKGEIKMQGGDRKYCSADMVSTPNPKKEKEYC